MTKRLDALIAREYESGGEKRTAFTKIGAAFETRNGGWSVVLDAMPAPIEGQFKILLMEPKEKKQSTARDNYQRGTEQAQSSYGTPLDDDLPF